MAPVCILHHDVPNTAVPTNHHRFPTAIAGIGTAAAAAPQSGLLRRCAVLCCAAMDFPHRRNAKAKAAGRWPQCLQGRNAAPSTISHSQPPPAALPLKTHSLASQALHCTAAAFPLYRRTLPRTATPSSLLALAYTAGICNCRNQQGHKNPVRLLPFTAKGRGILTSCTTVFSNQLYSTDCFFCSGKASIASAVQFLPLNTQSLLHSCSHCPPCQRCHG